jgi:hypothetical protein
MTTTLNKSVFLEHKEKLDMFVFWRDASDGMVEIQTNSKYAIEILNSITKT